MSGKHDYAVSIGVTTIILGLFIIALTLAQVGGLPGVGCYDRKRRVGSPCTWNVAFQQQQQFICDGNLL